VRLERAFGYLSKFSRSTKNQGFSRRVFLFSNASYARFGPKKERVGNYPIYALIEPTNNCNLKCETCIRHDLPFGFGDMSFENYKIIINKLKGLIRVHLQGQGEPFLHKDIFRMINYASDKGIIVTTTSNGTLLNSEMAKKIIESKLDEIVISVDSIDKETCESIRKGVKFDVLIDNIKRLSEMRKGRKKKLKMSIGMTIIKDNLKEIPEFIKFFSEMGINELIFQRLLTNEFYVKHYETNFLKEQLISEKELIKEIKKNKELAKRRNISILFDEGKCNWLWSQIYVNYMGDVNPCCLVLDPNNPKLGNLLKQDFKKIWNNQEYKNLRRLLINKKVPNVCKGCRRLWR